MDTKAENNMMSKEWTAKRGLFMADLNYVCGILGCEMRMMLTRRKLDGGFQVGIKIVRQKVKNFSSDTIVKQKKEYLRMNGVKEELLDSADELAFPLVSASDRRSFFWKPSPIFFKYLQELQVKHEVRITPMIYPTADGIFPTYDIVMNPRADQSRPPVQPGDQKLSTDSVAKQ